MYFDKGCSTRSGFAMVDVKLHLGGFFNIFSKAIFTLQFSLVYSYNPFQHFAPLVLQVIGLDVDCFSIVIKPVANQPVLALTLGTQAMSTNISLDEK